MLRLLLLSCLCIANTFAVDLGRMHLLQCMHKSTAPEHCTWRAERYTEARKALANYEQFGASLSGQSSLELLLMTDWLRADLADSDDGQITAIKLLTTAYYHVPYSAFAQKFRPELSDWYDQYRANARQAMQKIDAVSSVSDLIQRTHFVITHTFYPELICHTTRCRAGITLHHNTAAIKIAEIGTEYLNFAQRETTLPGVSLHCITRAIHYHSWALQLCDRSATLDSEIHDRIERKYYEAFDAFARRCIQRNQITDPS